MADEEELDPKEIRGELIKSLKVTRRQFFGFIPKGTLGQLILGGDKKERDLAVIAARKENGGGTPLMGMCSGGLNDKEFILDKKRDKLEELGAQIALVVKKSSGLTIKPTVKVKGQKDTEEEE